MTRATTWTNSDGLVVGFGPNFPERQVEGKVKTFGGVQEKRVQVTWQSTFGESGAGFRLPLNSIVHNVYFVVTTPWASGDSGTLSVGHTEADTADVDAFMTTTNLAAAAMTPAGKIINGTGVYLADTNSQKLLAVITDDFDTATLGAKVFFTLANTFTAGAGTLVVEYSSGLTN